MTPPSGLRTLSRMGVDVRIVLPDRLHLSTESGEVPMEAVSVARYHKPAIVEHLRPNCRPHNNPENYIDEELQPGVIRTTCRVCGRFVGYRYPQPSDPTLIDEE